MSKNLKVIQVIAKVAYVISYIVFVCSIIGVVASTITIMLSAIMFLINSPEINSLVGTTGLDVLALCQECLVAIFACVGGIVAGFMAKRYFKYQCDVGTPFTEKGADMLLKLGVAVLIIEVAIGTFEGITFAVYELFNIPMGDATYETDMLLGIAFIVFSFVFKYGAELTEAKKAEETVSDVSDNNSISTETDEAVVTNTADDGTNAE